ncbi:MAG: HIT domain-containing protein [Endomicrobia bacterium]|nr:HIT domain-containing protein [Endomicrobiia bacterium]
MNSENFILWAPWREKFVKKIKKDKSCIFCKKSKSKNDAKNYVVYRGVYNFVILNIYPYNNGHLMVAPYRHISDLDNLTKDELYELFDLVRKMVRLLRKTHKMQGCNIGINLGKVAGAGIEDHLHIHIVPRWLGDTNFMPIVAKSKVISESLNTTYSLIKKEVEKL